MEGVDLPEEGERVEVGVGDDAAVVRVNGGYIVQSLDFFTPIHPDPYVQGRIAANNSLNDVFAMGATEVLSVLVISGFPKELPEEDARRMLQGFADQCREVDAPVVGGHTIVNPWPILGGSVTGFAERYVTTEGARPGDVLYLTKPLGTQPAMALLRMPEDARESMFGHLDVERVEEIAVEIMTEPLLDAAEAALEAGATAMTDVTGFGLRGHAKEIAERSGVRVVIERLPVIPGMQEVSSALGYGLDRGESAETAGGLLVAVPEERAGELEEAFEERGVWYRRVGRIERGEGVTVDGELEEVEDYPR